MRNVGCEGFTSFEMHKEDSLHYKAAERSLGVARTGM
jgi:hypothetical protein